MRLQTKALYNVLRRNWLADPSTFIESWQVEDYREFSTYEIFEQLEALGLSLSGENFLIYAENYTNPEELTDFIWTKKEHKDQVYLLIFELWRRLVPEKQSLSIFCDELDHRIELYEKDSEAQSSAMENMMLRLEEVLNENADEGKKPQSIFQTLSLYCAHDVETFLYEYISDEIDSGNTLYAAELLEDFYHYLSDVAWFDFLRARLLAATDPHEANIVIKSILEEIKDVPDLDLLLEMASFLTAHGDPHLFYQAVRQAFELILTEEDFQELLAIVADYYGCCDMEKEEKAIQSVFAKRSQRDLNAPLDKADKDIISFSNALDSVASYFPTTEKPELS
jgi:hypothetical protein